MDTMPHDETLVTLGVDTHADLHVAVALDQRGGRLGHLEFATDRTGYQTLIDWASQLGTIDTIGIEGTGSWGRGLTLFCLTLGLVVREAGRPEPHPGWAPSLDVGGGRVALAIQGGATHAAQRSEEIPVGAPLRQPLIRRRGSDETPTRLDDVCGRGFALIGRTAADVALDDEARAIADRLGLRHLALEGLEVVDGSFDQVFEKRAAVLVRPDRYVFGVTDDETSASELVRLAATKIALVRD